MRAQAGSNSRIRISGNCELLLAIWLFFPIICMTFLNTVRRFVPDTYKLDTLLLYGLFGVMALLSIRRMLNRIGVWQILVCAAVIAALLFSALFSSEVNVNFAVIKEVCISCLPVLLLASTARNFGSLKHYLSVAALIAPYLLAYDVYVLGVGALESSIQYSQSMAYMTLLPAIILLSDIIDRFSVKKLIPLLISIFIMLSFGARGPITCVALFATIKLFSVLPSENKRKRTMIIAVALLLGGMLYIFFFEIMGWLMRTMNSLGFSVRIAESLLNRSFFFEFSTASGRIAIFNAGLKKVFAQPLWGTGLVNDRIYLAGVFGITTGSIGSYAHNFFIEVLMQFGILIGGVLLALFLRGLYRCLSRSISREARSVVLTLLGFGFFPLMFSGSYLDSSDFYALIGVCGAVLYTRAISMRKAIKRGVFHEGRSIYESGAAQVVLQKSRYTG